MTVIDTSTASTATAYFNQRKIDRCQNGVLWAAGYKDTQLKMQLWYSEDNGTTWTLGQFVSDNTSVRAASFSIFIDLDDYMHVVWKQNTTSSGYSEDLIYYMRGTPNAARTEWTWSSGVQVRNATLLDYPDLVAHREGTGWTVHVVSSSTSKAYFHRLSVTSGGVIAVDESLGDISNIVSGNFKYPSIDFNHTGDGKTVAGGAPHLYVAWSSGASGGGKGIRFRKATYSGGSWTWGTEREIDSTLYVFDEDRWINCLFDGTRILIAGHLREDSVGEPLILWERDAADTTTTVLVETGNTSAYVGSLTYDSEGNVYLFGSNSAEYGVSYRRWVRATATLENWVHFDSSDFSATSAKISAKRGYSNDRIEFVYTRGTSSPYDVTYGSITLNTAPNVPTNLAVTSLGTDTTPVFSADISDPDTGQQIKARFEVRTLAGVVLGTLDSAFRTGAGTVTKEWADALALGYYQVRVKTIDDAGEESVYTDWVDFTITKFVSPINLNLIWNVIGTLPKDLSLLWNIAEGNQKDLELVWNTAVFVPEDLELLWNKKTPWTEVTENTDIWRRVY